MILQLYLQNCCFQVHFLTSLGSHGVLKKKIIAEKQDNFAYEVRLNSTLKQYKYKILSEKLQKRQSKSAKRMSNYE